jgi:hypothetical protein
MLAGSKGEAIKTSSRYQMSATLGDIERHGAHDLKFPTVIQ